MIYGILSTITFIIIMPFWLILGVFKPKLINGFKEKCGFYGTLPDLSTSKTSTVIFYGVSVGEVIAMENLIKKTREKFQQTNIIVLTGTKTGQEIAHKRLDKTVDFISYFPFDFPFCIENMLKKLKPNAIFVMETELWPNFAHTTKKNNVPFYIINGRISDRTYNSYKKLSFFFGPILKKYTNIFTQSKQDNDKLVSIGANPETTKIMGNLKFDIKKPDTNSLNFERNPNHKILLAGSTHSGEDEIILEAFCELKQKFSNLKLLIAPRHPERGESVYNLMQKTGHKVAKRSEHANLEDNDIILLDTMGELNKFYSICDIAFIGGSFNKTGGHNPLEATIFKKPVVSGPSVHNFKDIYSILTHSNAAKVVNSKENLINEFTKFLQNETDYSTAIKACEEVFEENGGALDFVIDVLQSIV